MVVQGESVYLVNGARRKCVSNEWCEKEDNYCIHTG